MPSYVILTIFTQIGIGICGHNSETAELETVIDTKSPEARDWAEAV